jgi:inner membrane protein
LDNLAHTLFALALRRIPRLARCHRAGAALLLGANVPDVDAVTRLIGSAEYLEYHRGISHSIVGVVVQALLLAWLLDRFDRRRADRLASPPPGVFHRDGPLLPAFLGLASHLVLDLAIAYGLRPWLPFSGRWYYGDFLFVVDPWLWLLFGALAALPGAASRGGNRFYVLAAAAASLVVFLVEEGHDASQVLRIAWLPAVLVIGILRYHGAGERRPRLVTGVALAALGAYLGLLLAAKIDVTRRGDAALASALSPGDVLLDRALLPMPTRPLSWMLVAATQRERIWIPVVAFHAAGEASRIEHGMDDPLIPLALDTTGGRAFAGFARFPHALVEIGDDGSRIVLNDARYWYTDFCSVEIRFDREK